MPWKRAGLALVLGQYLTLAIAPTAAEARPRECFGKVAPIIGTRDADILHGTAGADVIWGRGEMT